MPPLTGYETHGGWTTLTEETVFLEQIAAETDAAHTTFGASRANGHPLHRIDIGQGASNTLMVVGLQHGDEPAPREAALILARDLAYSTDPGVLNYLATHRVVILPTLMPDGLPNSRSGGGSDINRLHFNLVPPEPRALSTVLADARPQILIDLHEYEYPTGDADGPDHLSAATRLPGGAPDLRAAALDLQASVRAMLEAGGRTTGTYNTWSSGTLNAAGSVWHAVTMLHESHRSNPLADRVSMTLDVLWHVINRHRTEAAYFKAISDGSREYARTTTAPYVLNTSTSSSTAIVELDLLGYEVAGNIPARVAAFGIEVVDGFASMNQDARPVIPILLDPESPYKAQTATRVQRPPDPDPPSGRGLRFADGTPVTLRRTDGTPITL